ncbi:MAG TPA: transposase [Desulfuromonadaceae bacterium]
MPEVCACRYPKAIETLENGLEDSLAFYSFPQLDNRKIASTNMLERLNEGIRHQIKVVGIFPNPALCAAGNDLPHGVFRRLIYLTHLHAQRIPR